jgi:hypothetical protein
MTYTDTFDSDFGDLTTDAAAYTNLVNQVQTDATNYQTALENIKKIKNPMVAFMMLMYLLAQQGSKQLDDTLASYGAGLQVQGDMTKLGNDLETQMNQNNPDTNLLLDHVKHLDKLLDALDATTGNMSLRAALGGTAADSMHAEYLVMRKDIDWNGETNPNYNPDHINPNPPTTGDRDYHFEVDTDGGTSYYITNYADLQKYMSAQGDKDQANEAYKKNNDAFNMNTSTTQSTNAASNQLINEQKNITTAIQNFMNDMMHADSDVISATIKAPKG